MKRIFTVLIILILSAVFSLSCSDNCDAYVAHVCDTCGDDSTHCKKYEDYQEALEKNDNYECNVTDKELEDWEKKDKKELCNSSID